jgi:hypothetical protein
VAGSEFASAQAFDNSVGTSKPVAVGGSLGETGSNFGRVLEDAAETAGDARPELAAGGAQLVDESGATVGVAKEAALQRKAKLVDENGTPIGHAKAASEARIPRGRVPVSDQSDIRSLLEDTERSSPRARGTESSRDNVSKTGRESRAVGSRRSRPVGSRSGDGGTVGIGERIAHQIERVMVGVPSATWMTLAGASLISSLALRVFGRRATANLLSGWAPTFLVCGLYNKLTTVGAATALLSSRR